MKPEIEIYGLHDSDTVVDIGCGNGRHAAYISHFYPSSFFILEDTDKNTIKRIDENFNKHHQLSMYIRERHRVVLGTSDTIPLTSSTYKYLLCRMSLHEFTNPTKMIQEMNRIMIPGGKLIVAESPPTQEGEKYSDCKKLLMPKQEIIDMLQNGKFVLIKSSDTKLRGGYDLAVLIFEKV